jgi:glycosyltransferase involved in cell wall biosynthesis
MRIVAIIAVRNECSYIANCLRHLVANQIEFAVIDNESDDGTSDIVRGSEFARCLLSYERFPFRGSFELEELLRAAARRADSLDADWLIHLDADEIMHSYRPRESLRSAIERIDRAGWDAINFDEFVFLPVDADYVPDLAGPQPLHYYYFFEPYRPRLMRARKAALGASITESGGHLLSGSSFKLAPETFALRHYIFRNQRHAWQKYTERKYSRKEVERGWHGNRVGFCAADYTFPPAAQLLKLADPEACALSRANPWALHYWEIAAQRILASPDAVELQEPSPQCDEGR